MLGVRYSDQLPFFFGDFVRVFFELSRLEGRRRQREEETEKDGLYADLDSACTYDSAHPNSALPKFWPHLRVGHR